MTINESERLHILKRIEDGEINAAEGIRLLNALSEDAAPVVLPRRASAPDPEFRGWKRWWLWPFGAGVLIAGFSGLLMYWAYRAADLRLSAWVILWSLPLLFGLFIMLMSFLSRNARWLHLRINTGDAPREWPRRIAISFPLPIAPVAWFLRLFGNFIPPLRRTGVDDLILALNESATPNSPLYVEVNEGGSGEKVQVYIG
jgi:hypothetical protein